MEWGVNHQRMADSAGSETAEARHQSDLNDPQVNPANGQI